MSRIAGLKHGRAALGLTLVCAFALTFFAVTTFGSGSSHEESPHRGGPVTPHVTVGNGTSQEFGDFRVLRASDRNGRECVAIEYRDALDNRVQAEGCDISADEPLATLVGRKEALVIGRVPAGTRRATIVSDGEARELRVQPAMDGSGAFVVAVLGRSRMDASSVVATDADGRVVGHYHVRGNGGPDDRATRPGR